MRIFFTFYSTLFINFFLLGQTSTSFSTLLSNNSSESQFISTIGDVFVETISSSENLLSQGYLQLENSLIIATNNINTFDFTIYPNPFNDILFLRSSDYTYPVIDIEKVEIIDLRSVILMSFDMKGNRSPRYSIDLSSLNSGIYFICIYSNEEVQIVKVIKI